MIHAFHIENGNVSYKNRWVRTPKWEIENKEGEGLSGTFGNPRYTDPRVIGAQLDHRQHQHRLACRQAAGARGGARALLARSGEPDARRGYETYGDKLSGPFTAHPKFDPETGEMMFFGYSAKGRFTKEVSIQTVTADGKRHARRDPGRPLPQHDPRLRRDEELDRRADLPAHQLDGTRHGRQAAVRLGARQGHAHRLHPAQRHRRRRQVGHARPPATSSIR